MKNIANYISISRIIMSIALLIPKIFSITFYIIYIYCGLSDMLDGFLARKYKITSKFGAKIDSIADMIFVFVSILKIIPVIEIPIAIYIWIIIIVLIKVFNIILGYISSDGQGNARATIDITAENIDAVNDDYGYIWV